jgi:hypothetical protein
MKLKKQIYPLWVQKISCFFLTQYIAGVLFINFQQAVILLHHRAQKQQVPPRLTYANWVADIR